MDTGLIASVVVGVVAVIGIVGMLAFARVADRKMPTPPARSGAHEHFGSTVDSFGVSWTCCRETPPPKPRTIAEIRAQEHAATVAFYERMAVERGSEALLALGPDYGPQAAADICAHYARQIERWQP